VRAGVGVEITTTFVGVGTPVGFTLREDPLSGPKALEEVGSRAETVVGTGAVVTTLPAMGVGAAVGVL